MQTNQTSNSSTKCDRCDVRKASLCGSASQQTEKELLTISHFRSYSAGETIVREGEEAGKIGNVVTGVLRVLKTMSDGRQQIVGILLPSDLFGRAFTKTSRFSIEAASDVTLCCFDRRSFERLLMRNQEIGHSMLINTLEELDSARDWMILLGCQNALERVASFLILLRIRSQNIARPHIPRIGMPKITVPISRRDMAAYLGTTVETISRTIQIIARKGAIKIIDPQNFAVLNWERLVKMSGREEFSSALAETRHSDQAILLGSVMKSGWREEIPGKSGIHKYAAVGENGPATLPKRRSGFNDRSWGADPDYISGSI